MPRHYDRDERSHEKSHGSPKRRKRSRSRDRYEKSRKRSPDHSKYHSKNDRQERNYSKNNDSNYNSDKLAGKWARNNSDSESEESENRNHKRSNRYENNFNIKSEERQRPNYKNHVKDESENPTSGVLNEEVKKEGPNLALSGKLMEDTNVFNGVTVKYSEPPEAKKPKRRWRFYVFKGEETMPVLHLHRQSAYLLGKDRKVADIPIDHPSCSRQHAVLQYRCIPGSSADGQKITRVLPYIIDLESSNGTFLNNKKIESKRYMELREKDVLKFGFSSREYVLLHDQSDGD